MLSSVDRRARQLLFTGTGAVGRTTVSAELAGLGHVVHPFATDPVADPAAAGPTGR